MSAGWQRVALAFFRVHALTPLAGLAVLHATALFFLLRSGSLPSRPSFDPSSLSFSGGPSVPESLQQILFPAALAWWLTLPLSVGVAVFAVGLRTAWSRSVVAVALLSLFLWHSDPTGLVTWLLD